MDFGIGLKRLLKQLSEVQQRRDAAVALDCLVCLLLFCPPAAYRNTRLNSGALQGTSVEQGHFLEIVVSDLGPAVSDEYLRSIPLDLLLVMSTTQHLQHECRSATALSQSSLCCRGAASD